MMTVRNEEEWVELSLRSVATIADEIVFVDNGSSDETREVAAETIHYYGFNAKLLSFPKEDFCEAVNHTLANTTRRWILRWHGDFVGRTSGPRSLTVLRDRIMTLDPRRYHCIQLGPVSLDGDLLHQEFQQQVELEPLLYGYSPDLHYEQRGRFESLVVPYYYEKLDWRELYFFHMRWVKPADRLLYRWFWTEWMSLPDKSQWPTLRDFVVHKARVDWGIGDLGVAAAFLVNSRCKGFVPYDSERFGPYPDLLREKLLNPPFRIVYKDGRIVGRSDTLEPELQSRS